MSNFNTILAEKLAEMNKVTNADRIRAMSDEDLAIWISMLYSAQYHIKADPHYWAEWLQQEVTE